MAFSTTFTGSAGTALHTADGNWGYSADGSVPDSSTGSINALQIATGGAGIRDQNIGSNTYYTCPDQGVDGSNQQYIKVKYHDVTPNNQLRPMMFVDSVNSIGVWFSITTSGFVLVRYGSTSSPSSPYQSAIAVNAGDIVHLYCTGAAGSTFAHLLINGVEDANSPGSSFNNTSVTTRQGIQVLTGQSVLDPWVDTFEAGSGTGLPPGGPPFLTTKVRRARHALVNRARIIGY